nr:probable WRKY transcription factor 19 isoform X2 [Ziziphus jujuba var. spinosa]
MASCSSSQEEYEYEGSASQEEYESSSSQEQYEYEGSASQEEDESSSSQEEHEYEGSASHEEYESSSSQEQYEYEGSASQEEDESSSSQEEHEYEGSASHEEYESSSSQEEHEYEGSASQEEYESSSSQEEYEYESYSSQEEYEYERTSSQKEYKYESSSSHEEYEFEVFLSFRGKDTRRGFTGHLYDALHKKNIRTFMDDKKAETGYKISPQLRKAMMGSKIWIIVFSKDFASSRWCLDEVRQILECNRNRNGEIKGNVIPIFYGIKPTVVRQQEESYAVAFAKHAECFKDRIEMVQQWRDALDEVCDVAGHDSENFRYDHELIDKIVNDVLLKLPKDQLTIDHFKKNLIGIEERVKDIESLLCIDSKDDARIIGIWGMGGIESRLYGRRCLSMHDLLREVGQAIVCDESKIPGNRSRLWTATDICHILENNKGTDAIQGILLNLSDRGIKKNVQVSPTAFLHMCHLRYLEIYEGETQYDGEFGPGYLQDPYNIYASEGLFDISEELRYLRWDSCPLKYLPNFSPKNLVGLIMHGSKIEKLWNEVQLLDLEKLKKIDLSYSKQLTRIPNLSGAINLEIISLRGCINLVQIHLNLQSLRKLQILDLSHCYNLKECGSSESQEMLSSIPVGLDFSYCTGLRSRSILWNEVQLKKIDASYCEHLTEIPNLSGAINLETITLRGCKSLVQVALNFQNHPKLRILDLSRCENLEEFRDSENIATNNTAFVEEETSSSASVELYFSNCERLRSIPESIGKLRYLYRLDLSDCPNLEKFPEISSGDMKCLHWLSLEGTGIKELPESIENVKKLKYLSLKDCKRLKSLPQSIWKLNYLKRLIVPNCPNLRGKFPEICNVIEYLYEIDLRGTGIEKLPESIENIEKLKHLNLKDCKRLKILPQSIWKLKYLEKLILLDCPNLQGKFPEICDVMECLNEIDLGGTRIEELPESIENLTGLTTLNLGSCPQIKFLPNSLCKLSRLVTLKLEECSSLEELPRLPLGLEKLDIKYCESLEINTTASIFIMDV